MRNGLLLFLSALFLLPLGPSALASEEPGVVRAIRVAEVINPVVASFIAAELRQAHAERARAFLLELDTPGGLDTAMREIIQEILGSEIPVIVYVYPAGARAASAGALITLAADFAVMSPGSNIGAAHPVAVGQGGEQDPVMTAKVVQDAVAYARSIAEQRGRNRDWAERIVRESLSTPASEALELKVIDLIAETETELLEKLDGRRYLRQGQERILRVAGATLVRGEMSWRQGVLNVLSNPTVAYLLLMLGMLGIFFEVSQPGSIFPGAIGAIALLLALFAFQTLPVNYAGVLLILLALVLFLLEIKITSYGMLTVGGILALALGSLMLIDSAEPFLQISRAVIFATVAVTGGFCAMVLLLVVRNQKTRFVSGIEGMVGEQGVAVTPIDGHGRVFVHGEYWEAESAESLPAGTSVVVIGLRPGMVLEVRRQQPRSPDAG